MKTQEVEFEVVGKEVPRRKAGAAGRADGAPVDPFIALMARLMDDIFVIPGTGIRFGLDPIIGLLPAFGATASAGVSLVLIALSSRRGVPKIILARMATNVLINAALDSVPVVGDALSIFFRSNARNYELLQKHAGTTTRASTRGDWIFLGALLASVIGVIALMIIGTFAVLHLVVSALSR